MIMSYPEDASRGSGATEWPLLTLTDRASDSTRFALLESCLYHRRSDERPKGMSSAAAGRSLVFVNDLMLDVKGAFRDRWPCPRAIITTTRIVYHGVITVSSLFSRGGKIEENNEPPGSHL